MDYLPTLCFEDFNSKSRKFQQEIREKEQLQHSILRQSFVCRDKRLRKWLGKSVMTIFLLSQHKGLNIEEELCRNKRQRVVKEHGKFVTSQLR